MRNLAVGLGTAVGYLNLDISGFANGVDSAISDMNKLEGKIKTTSDGFNAIGGMFTKAGTALTAGFTAPIAGAAAASVKFGTDFDKQMSNVKAVTGATTEDFNSMREAAIKWGEKTKYTATEAAEAMYYMGLAGWDSRESIEGLGSVLSLAAAGDLELGRTSDIVTDALTAFGLTAQDTTEFTNVLAATMSNSNTDVDKLGESFKYVAPVAGAFGYTAQDTALALGLFANNGVKASQAGTGLRQALNALTKPSENAEKLMDQYGVSLFNADGSTKSLMQVMEQLRGTFGNVSVNAEEVDKLISDLGVDLDTSQGQAEATRVIMEKFGHDLPVTEMENLTALVNIMGVRALPGMLSVINASDDDFYGLAEKIYGANEAFVQFGDEVYTIEEALDRWGDRIYTDDSFEVLGAAAGMAQVQMDNLAGDWTKFTSALGTSQILISDMAKGALRELVQSLTDIVNWFNNLDEEQREQIVKWALIVASIGPVLLIIGKLITGVISLIQTINTMKQAFSVISPVFTRLGSDITGFISLVGEQGLMGTLSGLTGLSSTVITAIAGITAAVVVLGAAFLNLWNTNEEFRAKIIEIWEGIKAKFEEAGQRIVEIFNELGFDFESFGELVSAVIEGLKAAWEGFCELVAPVFVAAFEIVSSVIGGVVDIFVGVIEVIAGIVKGFKDGDWSMVWEGIADIVSGAVDLILGSLDGLAGGVWGVIQTVANWFGADWNMTWDEAKQAVSDWFSSIMEWFAELPGNIMEFFANIWSAITNFIAQAGSWIASIPGKILGLISTVGSAILGFIGNVIQWFAQLPGRILGFFASILSGVVQWGAEMIAKAIEIGSQFLGNVVQFFAELPNKIAYYIGYAMGSVIKWGIEMVATAVSMGASFLEAVVSFFVQLPQRIVSFITTAYQKVSAWASNMVSKAKEMATNFLNNVVTFFVQLPIKVTAFIMATQQKVYQWATDMVNKAKEMASNFLSNVVNFFAQLPGKIQSFVSSAFNYVASWASNMVNKAREMAQNFLSNVVSFFSQLPGKVQSFLSSVISSVTSWASEMVAKGMEAAKGFFNAIVEGLAGLPAKVKEIGSNIVNGIWEGISGGWGWLKSKVASLAESLLEGAKDALGIESPSKEFRDQVGRWIPPGIAEGFARAMPSLVNFMQDELDDGVGSLSVADTDLEMPMESFIDSYKDVFEGLVVWFESMEERMANAVESLADYFKYMMYVRQMLNSDEEFRSFILNSGDKKGSTQMDNNSDTSGVPITSVGDVFNFYSPKSIDEVQAARLLRNTKRDLAEGF